MKLTVEEFAKLVRIIRRSPRPQAVFVLPTKDGKDQKLKRVNPDCRLFRLYIEEHYDRYVGTYYEGWDRDKQNRVELNAGWLADDLREAGVHLVESREASR